VASAMARFQSECFHAKTRVVPMSAFPVTIERHSHRAGDSSWIQMAEKWDILVVSHRLELSPMAMDSSTRKFERLRGAETKRRVDENRKNFRLIKDNFVVDKDVA